MARGPGQASQTAADSKRIPNSKTYVCVMASSMDVERYVAAELAAALATGQAFTGGGARASDDAAC